MGTTCSSYINDVTKIPTTVLKKFEEEKHFCKNLSSMDEHTNLVSKIEDIERMIQSKSLERGDNTIREECIDNIVYRLFFKILRFSSRPH